MNLEKNDYNSNKYGLSVINATELRIENFLNTSIRLNNHISYCESVKNLLSVSSIYGFILEEWIDRNENDIVLLYNDSALLSLPVMLHTLTNFYSVLDNIPLINTTLSTLPKIQQNDFKVFDSNIFVSLIVLGIGFVLPALSFIAEIVEEKEVSYFFKKLTQIISLNSTFYFS